MPTYGTEGSFRHDFQQLSIDRQKAFMASVSKLVADLRGGSLRKGLRINHVQGHQGVWEMTWANDGRATFRYGESVIPGEPHIIWRRIGGHEILDNP